jgi:hypothetical protein
MPKTSPIKAEMISNRHPAPNCKCGMRDNVLTTLPEYMRHYITDLSIPAPYPLIR